MVQMPGGVDWVQRLFFCFQNDERTIRRGGRGHLVIWSAG
jgi:hypothetical protein